MFQTRACGAVCCVLRLTLAWRCRASRLARVRLCVLDALFSSFFPATVWWALCGSLLCLQRHSSDSCDRFIGSSKSVSHLTNNTPHDTPYDTPHHTPHHTTDHTTDHTTHHTTDHTTPQHHHNITTTTTPQHKTTKQQHNNTTTTQQQHPTTHHNTNTTHHNTNTTPPTPTP